MKKLPKSESWRRGFQYAVFVFVLLIAVSHSLEESGRSIPFIPSASLHAVCPLGGPVTLYQWISTGTFVQKIHESSLVLGLAVVALAIAFGPVFCGWVCPMGTIQEVVGRLGRRIFKKRYNRFVPSKADKVLRYLRYLVLAWVLVMTGLTGKLIFSDYDPYFALFNLWTGEVAITGYVILGLTLFGSLFVERPFCKYACPYGALLGITNLFRIFKIRRNAPTCIDCGACDRACPMNITVSKSGAVRDHQCIGCLKCASDVSCPVPDTVELRLGSFPETKAETTAASSGKGGVS